MFCPISSNPYKYILIRIIHVSTYSTDLLLSTDIILTHKRADLAVTATFISAITCVWHVSLHREWLCCSSHPVLHDRMR